MDATVLMAKGRMTPKEMECVSQHAFRSKRREMARRARDAKLLDVQLELLRANYDKLCLQEKMLEALAEVRSWTDWWDACWQLPEVETDTGEQDLCAANKPANEQEAFAEEVHNKIVNEQVVFVEEVHNKIVN